MNPKYIPQIVYSLSISVGLQGIQEQRDDDLTQIQEWSWLKLHMQLITPHHDR